MREPRPPCRCKERTEAMLRIKDCPDQECIDREQTFIAQTMREDVKAQMDWARNRVRGFVRGVVQ